MAKSKKNRQQDFQKVKLKIGKKLRKGDNVTNASFKSKSIQIKEQLKTDTGQPTTKKKQSITDLLCHLNHYNVSMKHDALAGLRDLLITNTSVLLENLSIVLDRTCSLFTDKDTVVRQAVIKLFRHIFPLLSANQIAPFFPVMSAHLCCAMTHIYEDIRLDSLNLFDLFLEHFPLLTTSASSNIMQNFLEQISTKNQSKAQELTAGRSLTVNPNSKLSSQKWRVKILNRLHSFLEAVLKTRASIDKQDTRGVRHSEVRVSPGSAVHFQKYKVTQMQQGFRLSMSSKPAETDSSGSTIEETDDETWKSYITTLMPLLFECWVESSPVQDNTDMPWNTLPPDTVPILTHILNVIQLLWSCLNTADSNDKHSHGPWLAENYKEQVFGYVLPHFPYVLNKNFSRTKGNKRMKITLNDQVSVLPINLAVCDIIASFMVAGKATSSEHDRKYSAIVDYLTQILQGRLTATYKKQVLEIFKKMLGAECVTTETGRSQVLAAVYNLYSKSHHQSQDTRLCLEFFDDIVFSRGCTTEYLGLSPVMQWISSLPGLLVLLVDSASKNVDMFTFVLRCVKRALICTSDEAFATSIVNKLEVIFESNGIFLHLSNSAKRILVEILYWLPSMPVTLTKHITSCCRKTNVEVVKYTVSTLYQRLITRSIKYSGYEKDVANFYSFLLSLGFGPSDFVDGNGENLVTGHNLWSRQMEVTKIASCAIALLPDDLEPWKVTLGSCHDIMISEKATRNRTIYGISEMLLSTYKDSVTLDKQAMDHLTAFCTSVLIAIDKQADIPTEDIGHSVTNNGLDKTSSENDELSTESDQCNELSTESMEQDNMSSKTKNILDDVESSVMNLIKCVRGLSQLVIRNLKDKIKEIKGHATHEKNVLTKVQMIPMKI